MAVPNMRNIVNTIKCFLAILFIKILSPAHLELEGVLFVGDSHHRVEELEPLSHDSLNVFLI